MRKFFLGTIAVLALLIATTSVVYGGAFFKQGQLIQERDTLSGGGTTVLTATSNVQQIVTSGSETVVLPDATTLPNGREFVLRNSPAAGTLTVQFDDTSTAFVVGANQGVTARLVDNGSSNGSWHFDPINDLTGDVDQVLMNDSATPAAPSATQNKLYFKSDGDVYKISSSGGEQKVGPGVLQVEQESLFIENPAAKVYKIILDAKFAYDVDEITAECGAGTDITWDAEINGTDITSCSAITTTTSEVTSTCTALNSLAIGATLQLNVTAIDGCLDWAMTIKITRT